MAETGFTRLPVLENLATRKLAGMISLHGLLHAGNAVASGRAPPRGNPANPSAVHAPLQSHGGSQPMMTIGHPTAPWTS
jgi:hypothetical protein